MNTELASQNYSIADTSIEWPTLAEVISVMTFQAGHNSTLVLTGATILGMAAGLVGTFALLRKRALMGDALAHSTLPGIALAFIFGASTGLGSKELYLLLPGACITGLIGIACVQLITKYSRLTEDTAIGAVLSCFFGLGIVLLSYIQSMGTGTEAGLSHFIYGQTAAMNKSDANLILAASLTALLFCLALLKEFQLVSFDLQYAKSQGWNTQTIDFMMMSLVVMVIVIGLQAVGLLLIVALLVIPATSARFWTESLKSMAFYSTTIGGLSAYLGACLSTLLPRLPAGAVIVMVCGLIFLFSFTFSPSRGLISKLLKQLRLSFRVTKDHLLRELIELHEVRHPELPVAGLEFKLHELALCRNWSKVFSLFFLSVLRFQNLLSFKYKMKNYYITLSPEGILQANKRVRNHRLWEQYLASQTELPVSHIDFSADLVEHVLSPQIVELLEKNLASESDKRSIASIHPLGGDPNC